MHAGKTWEELPTSYIDYMLNASPVTFFLGSLTDVVAFTCSIKSLTKRPSQK